MAKEGSNIGSVVDTALGVFDTVTGDALDLDKSKKKEKKIKKQIQEQDKKAKIEQGKEKEKQKKTEINFYESLRQGNLGLLKPKDSQTIG